MKYINLEEIIVNMPIYDSFDVSFADNDNILTDDGKELLSVLFHKNKINLKCIECNKEYPFSVSYNIKRERSYNFFTIDVFGSIGYSIDSKTILEYTTKAPSLDEGIINYTLRCAMDEDHYYDVYLKYSLNNGKINIYKIGQYPTTRELGNSLSSQYKKILNKYDSLEDYRMHEQSTERNLLAGSCTYLRRVFEKIVNKMLNNDCVSEEERTKAIHFADKIKVVKPQFDKDIQEILEQSHGLLSKSIHELTNDEINTFHRFLVEVVDVQLESETEAIQRDTKMKELRKNVNKEYNNNK